MKMFVLLKGLLLMSKCPKRSQVFGYPLEISKLIQIAGFELIHLLICYMVMIWCECLLQHLLVDIIIFKNLKEFFVHQCQLQIPSAHNMIFVHYVHKYMYI